MNKLLCQRQMLNQYQYDPCRHLEGVVVKTSRSKKNILYKLKFSNEQKRIPRKADYYHQKISLVRISTGHALAYAPS